MVAVMVEPAAVVLVVRKALLLSQHRLLNRLQLKPLQSHQRLTDLYRPASSAISRTGKN